jgi:hypothetical protein
MPFGLRRRFCRAAGSAAPLVLPQQNQYIAYQYARVIFYRARDVASVAPANAIRLGKAKLAAKKNRVPFSDRL